MLSIAKKYNLKSYRSVQRFIAENLEMYDIKKRKFSSRSILEFIFMTLLEEMKIDYVAQFKLNVDDLDLKLYKNSIIWFLFTKR